MSLRERKKQQTRIRLLEIAEQLFSELPYEEVMVDEIVARAEISQKTFFNYFPSKAYLLEELLLSLLREINAWSFESEPELNLRSAIVPPNIEEIQDWIIKHRRILQMIMYHTDLFSSVYFSGAAPTGKNLLFPATYRKPRMERVIKAQSQGVIRTDISAELVCDMYDWLRIDVVQRWLALPDEQASAENYKKSYDEMVDVLCRGFEPLPLLD
ncbi:TetR/AcrR family transcriptional regulator [Microbulbifer hainanensis]|uniref:TetR/AcrR family transcriptional regulator n=1 Tax=Microbulbifer hainanensis TaxID=2735675 RepID=UPI001866C7D2|nr:TetR/AcrR family transcriptional regulator [Microbulbifer hainanensis]